jgi:hypothetical protein
VIILPLLIAMQNNCWETYTETDGVQYIRWVCEGQPPDTSDTANAYRDVFRCCINCEIEKAELAGQVQSLQWAIKEKPPVNFQECLTGPADPNTVYLHTRMAACRIYDHDQDGDIDLKDFSLVY